jgi:virginiamycin B lyase
MTTAGKVTRRFISAQFGDLVRAPDGDLWATDRGGNSIWQISPGGGEPRRYAIPTTTGREGAGPGGPFGSGPSGITVGRDGTIWFVETEADQVGRLIPAGNITEIPLFGPGSGFMRPSAITAAPDGSIWVTAGLGRGIVRVDGRTLAIRKFPVPSPGGTVFPHWVVADSEGGVWFDRPSPSAMDPKGAGPALGRMASDGTVTYHALPGDGREPGSLTVGPDRAIWFLDSPARAVGRMAPDGSLTEFPFATGGYASGARQLAAGSDRLWFAQPHTNSLGLITCRPTSPPPD